MDSIKLISRIARAKYEQLCPECGAKMTEAERVCENGIVFVWYRCSMDECAGQWLQKTPQMPASLGAFNRAVGAF
jgi:hypothetical protein